ncbi:MAG: hypothetical protein ABWY05_00945 [Noviherbaspirillum sp.]
MAAGTFNIAGGRPHASRFAGNAMRDRGCTGAKQANIEQGQKKSMRAEQNAAPPRAGLHGENNHVMLARPLGIFRSDPTD